MMKLEKKWYNLITLLVMLVFAFTVYQIMAIIIQVEMGQASMNKALKEELYSYLWYLSVILVTFIIRKKENNHTPLESEA